MSEISHPRASEGTEAVHIPETLSPVKESTAEISLLDVLLVLARRKWIILSATVVFAAVAIVVSLLLPVRYTASATLLPPQQNSSMAALMSLQLSSIGGLSGAASSGLGLKNPNDIYVAMFRSRVVEDGMIQRFALMRKYKQRYMEGARKVFEARSDVNGSGKDGLIHISVQDRDPNDAANMANGYIDQFRYLTRTLAITEASQRRLFFERELAQAKDDLANAEEEFKKMQLATGVIQLDSQARALISESAVLRAQLAAKEVQIDAMRTYATSDNPQLIQAQQELNSLQKQVTKLGGSAEGPDAGLIVPKGRVPEAGLEYERKLRNVKYYEAVLDILARQFELAKLDEARQGAVIQVVDAAVPPERRSFPERGIIVLLATAAGLFCGVVLALLQAGFQRIRQMPETWHKIQLLRMSALRLHEKR